MKHFINKTTIAFSLGVLLSGQLVYPISRVGGGTNSVGSMFTAELPFEFQNSEQLTPTSLGLKGPIGFSRTSIVHQYIWMKEFSDDFGKLSAADRQQTIDWFQKNGFALEHNDPSDCAVIFSKETDSTLTFVGTWGKGRGFSMYGTNTAQTYRALQEILRSVVLRPGACAWN